MSSGMLVSPQVTHDKLRYIVGCCLPDPPSRKLEEMLKTNGYSFWTFPECTSAVVTEFPVRSMVSHLIAPWRVYPALVKYFEVGGVASTCWEQAVCAATALALLVIDTASASSPPSLYLPSPPSPPSIPLASSPPSLFLLPTETLSG